ncbi:MAG: hypothetical protein Q9184_000087 [Pyrenodesmia sp. 2 TL-2023]
MGNIDDKRSLMPTDIVERCVLKIRYAAAQTGLPLVLNTTLKIMVPFAGGPSTLPRLQAPDIWVTSILAQIGSFFEPSLRQQSKFSVLSGSSLDGAPGTSSDKYIEHVASEVLDLLTQYGRHDTASADSEVGDWPARAIFADKVKDQVSRDTPIKMVLPSFPWKSINQVDKVIGSLPDLGEVLALARLNQLCRDIESIYPPGDVVGISEEHTWEYSEALARIIEEKGFDRLKLRRVMDVIGFTDQQPMTKQIYLSLTNPSRTTLMQKYGRTEDDIRALIATDHDTLMTYRGFIRFLENDLRYSAIASKARSGSQYRKSVKLVAKAMMIRAEKSALWDWEDSSTDSAVFEPQYPKGLLIHPAQDSKAGQCLGSDRVQKLKSLAEVFEGPIQVFGFANAIEVNEEMEQVAIDIQR